MSIPLTSLASRPDDVLTVHKVVTSVTFWTTLLGAMTAFALGRFGQWRSALNERRSAGNLAIVTLAEMYSEAKALYDSIFVVAAAETRRQLGRDLLAFEYRAVIDIPTVPDLDLQRLGFLADSHDADILARVTAARNHFAGMMKLAAAHSGLSQEIQAALGKNDPTGKAIYRPDEISAIVGPHLIIQVSSVVSHLKRELPVTMEGLLAVGAQLRDVLRYVMPSRSFLKFIPQDRGPVAQATIYARRPALWRRVVRSARAAIERASGRS